MRKLFLGVICSSILFACNNKPTETSTSTSTDSSGKMNKTGYEFADSKYMDVGRNSLKLMESGDMDGWINRFADTALYLWSSGDSLRGKTAIGAYWKNRRMNVIDSMSFANDIWLPIKVNQPQKGPDQPGIWLMGWYQVHTKYKTGKSLTFWVHTDWHFNSDDKVDLSITYLDRAPINVAAGGK
jgi:hypothetical protein